MKIYLGTAVLMSIYGFHCPALANQVSVSGNPGALVISSATAGIEPLPVTDTGSTYSIDITTSNMKLTGSINSAMPANTYLKITLSAPSGATSVGRITLTTTDLDLVTSLDSGMVEGGLGISYEFSATVAAGVIATAAKTVTFTITDAF